VREKIKKIQSRIDQDPKLQKALSSIKPKKSLWGILGVIGFFFLPELLTYIWQEELIEWSHGHTLTEPSQIMRTLFAQLEAMFRSGVSWVNLIFGTLLLFWVLKSK